MGKVVERFEGCIMKMKKCPRCGTLNDYDWPLNIDGAVKDGGCQDCWEAESDRAWWVEIEKLTERAQEETE